MEAPPPFELIKVQIPKSDMYTLDAIRLEMQSYISDRIKFYNHAMPEMLEFYNDCVYSYELSIQTDPRAMEQLALYKAIVHRFRTSGYNSFTDVQDGMFCKKVEEEMEARMRGGELKEFRNIKSAVKYLPLKLRGEALGNVLGRARINAIKDTIAYAGLPEMIDNVEKKTVIFTSYIDALKITEEYLTKQGYGVVTVYGENSKERDDAIRRFEKDPKLHVLVAVYDSLKEGYPLLMANQIICLNAPFRDHELKQVQARIWRTGQDTMCFFKMLDLDTGEKLNITTRSINIMEWSREQVDALLSRQQVNLVLDNVSGQEMFEMSDEPVCLPMQVRNNALSLFL
jgi:SNF2 family DNA or RNA helicase